jgi:hypothetical protein
MKTTALNLAQICRGSSFDTIVLRRPICYPVKYMNESNEKPPRYKWPWFVLVGFILFVLLAIAWMSYAVHEERENLHFSAPPSSSFTN